MRVIEVNLFFIFRALVVVREELIVFIIGSMKQILLQKFRKIGLVIGVRGMEE